MQYLLVGGIGAVVVVILGLLLSYLDMGGRSSKNKVEKNEPDNQNNK